MRRQWRAEVDFEAVKVGLVLATPALLMGLIAHDPLQLYCLLLTFSAAIIVDKLHLNWTAALLLCIGMLVCVRWLLLARQMPGGFTLSCVALAAISVGMGVWGKEWRTMGSFVFIPSVYLACEFGSRSVHLQALPADKTLLGAAVVALAIVPFYAFSRQWRAGVSRAWWTLRRPGELGARVEVGRSLLSACLAVAVASSVVELTNMNHGQWLIWSALSVITADLASSRAKSRDRMIAALWGVPAGIVLGSLVLPSIYSIAAFGLLGGLSLTCVPRYSLAYGLRTLAAVGGLILAGCSAQESAWRLVNGLLGVVIGATSMAVFYCGRPANAA